ncbi:MAG: hypothetical protein NVSMB9_20310 [Isosphaeraceae bacterium]
MSGVVPSCEVRLGSPSSGGYNGAMPFAPMSRPAFLIAILLTLATLAGCGGGEDVTPETLRLARGRWERAGIRDYDLEWTSSGRSIAHYAVVVRDGRVRTIESVAPDGRRGEVKPGAPEFYGVDGLFTTLEDELAQLDQPAPFGQPRGTRAILRFTADPKYGYPLRYRRDVLGASLALGIDVVRFHPLASRGTSKSP